MEPFNKEYAEIYDFLYTEKDYHDEVNLIEQAIRKYKPDTKKILDYGCGTANHTMILSSKGYEIYGLDRNNHMLAIARLKLKDKKNIRFYNTDEKDVLTPDSIDMCITLFDVISYMNTNEEINDFLDYLRKVLVNRGLFVFDFWYGPGVVSLGPEKKWKEYDIGEKKVLRLINPLHDRNNCIVTVTQELIITEKDRIFSKFVDNHSMRYFFKNEVLFFLNYYGFEILKFGTWKNPDITPTTNDWSALVVCKLAK